MFLIKSIAMKHAKLFNSHEIIMQNFVTLLIFRAVIGRAVTTKICSSLSHWRGIRKLTFFCFVSFFYLLCQIFVYFMGRGCSVCAMFIEHLKYYELFFLELTLHFKKLVDLKGDNY